MLKFVRPGRETGNQFGVALYKEYILNLWHKRGELRAVAASMLKTYFQRTKWYNLLVFATPLTRRMISRRIIATFNLFSLMHSK